MLVWSKLAVNEKLQQKWSVVEEAEDTTVEITAVSSCAHPLAMFSGVEPSLGRFSAGFLVSC